MDGGTNKIHQKVPSHLGAFKLRILSHDGASTMFKTPILWVCTYAAVLTIEVEKIRLSSVLLKSVSTRLLIHRLTLDTELGLYGTRSSTEREKRSPPEQQKPHKGFVDVKHLLSL